VNIIKLIIKGFLYKTEDKKQHPASNKVKSQPGEPLWQEQGMVDGRQ